MFICMWLFVLERALSMPVLLQGYNQLATVNMEHDLGPYIPYGHSMSSTAIEKVGVDVSSKPRVLTVFS